MNVMSYLLTYLLTSSLTLEQFDYLLIVGDVRECLT